MTRESMRYRSRSQRGQATPSIVVVASAVVALASLVALFVGGVGEAPSTPAPSQTRQVASTPSPEPTTEESPASQGPKSEEAQGERATDERAMAREKDRRAAKRKPRERQQQSRPQEAPDEPTVPDVYVEVYNNSAITGLAASTAARLQDGGWQIVGVDNWYGAIPASTVYYPSGLSAEAHQLARALGVRRVRGAVSPMKFDRLTVILTPDAA
ncbi:MAG: LytR C-terminal domain-containing protein [Nocardioidaceae bacterium]